MPVTSEKYSTDYFYKKINDGIPIVFIHGVGLTKEIWDPQIKFFNNYNLLSYDLIGHGKSPLKKSSLNFEDFNKQLLNLINELEIDKIHLVGFSMGSLIARHFASSHNYRLSSLVLHGSIYKRSEDQQRVVQNRFELIKNDRPAAKDRALRRWFSEEFIKENKGIYEKIYKMLDDNDLGNLLRAYKLYVNYEDNDKEINDIVTKTLVTTGQFDVASTPEMSKKLSEKINKSQYIEIPNGRHLCNIECDGFFNKALEKFIDKNYEQN